MISRCRTRSAIARLTAALVSAALVPPILAQTVVPEGVLNSCDGDILGTLDSSSGFDGTCFEFFVPAAWDFYTFEGTAGQVVEFEVDRAVGEFDPFLSVWQGDPTGVPLSSFSDADSCSNPSVTWLASFFNEDPPAIPGPLGDPHGSLTLPADGTYFVLVAGTCSHAGAASYDYILRAVNVPGPVSSIMNIDTGMTYATVQNAVDAAENGETIELGCGIVYEHDITVDKRLTIRGQGMDDTIIDAERLGPCVRQHSNELTIEDLTIRNGLSGTGGGFRVDAPAPSTTLRNIRFLSNEANWNGGGMACLGATGGHIVIDRCEFIDNRASGPTGVEGLGGAILLAQNDETTAAVTNTLFRANSCGVRAGVMWVSEDTLVRFTNNTIAGHPLSDIGNDRLIIAHSAQCELFMNNCIFSENQQVTIRASGGASASMGDSLLQDDMILSSVSDAGGNSTALPIFVDEANGDYRLDQASPGIDAANLDAYLAAGAGTLDLAGSFRFYDDPGTANSGVLATDVLDLGAYESAGTSPVQPECPGDINNSGFVDFDDLNILLSNWGVECN